ncbi:hypothetical protein AF332_25690 [Sporosarcina globispora]|uniref:Uncharacterized protein n=1 Tax=Sporosarcina globispora TaxID=1459 RepID=A0A0M0GIX4_SPOGL|nr:hypothetical protein [Sporosarcina globispora]KON89875.1 hypothetical protein AF332_25690 [Sporosarcina globispora]
MHRMVGMIRKFVIFSTGLLPFPEIRGRVFAIQIGAIPSEKSAIPVQTGSSPPNKAISLLKLAACYLKKQNKKATSPMLS